MDHYKNIGKWTLGYYLLQHSVKLLFCANFKKYQIVNFDHLPKDRPIIVAVNHQNALLDALPIVFLPTKTQFVMLARADIFRKKRQAQFLRFIKIMPVFRIRDGASNLSKNEETFAETAGVLINKGYLGMMPEGNHGNRRRLRKLNKGIFRIGMLAQEHWGENKGVAILPVGLDFSHYQNFRSNLLVNFGELIELNKYYKSYTENQVQAFNDMKSELERGMKKVMIHIDTEEYYELYMNIKTIYNKDMRAKLGIKGKKLIDKFNADKVIIDKLDAVHEKDEEKIKNLNQKFISYQQSLNKLKIQDSLLKPSKSNPFLLLLSLIGFVAGLPLMIFGLIHNFLPYTLGSLISNKIKDTQFISSIKFGVLTSSFYILNLFIVLPLVFIFVPTIWAKLIYIALIPFTGIFAFDYLKAFGNWLKGWKICFAKLFKNKNLLSAQAKRSEIISEMDKITA